MFILQISVGCLKLKGIATTGQNNGIMKTKQTPVVGFILVVVMATEIGI